MFVGVGSLDKLLRNCVFFMDKCKQSPSVASVCHFLAYNPCDVVEE